MPITDLLDRVPFSPSRPAAHGERAHGKPSSATAGSPPEAPPIVSAGDGMGAERLFEIELPDVELNGVPLPHAALVCDEELEEPTPTRSRASEASAQSLPSWVIALIGTVSLACLVLTATLAVAVVRDEPLEFEAVAADTEGASASLPMRAPEPLTSPPVYSAEPAPIPVDLITRLEDASGEPLDVELTRLLDAIQHGFGQRSAQLEPTLRSYVYRMASRFEWNPDSFRVAVTAPDPDLAAARAALLKRLFEDAVAVGRLDVGTGVGPDALSLVTE